MGEEPGTAEGEPGDLHEVEEPREAGVEGWWGGRGGGGEEGGGGVGEGEGGGRFCGFGGGEGGVVGGDDEEGEEHAGGEGDDGEEEERECPSPRGIFPCLVDFVWGEVRVGGEDWVYFELGDVGRHVEEEAEPAHPVEELRFADFANLRRQPPDGVEDLAEEGDQAWVALFGCTFDARIALTNVEAGDEDCGADGEGSDGGQDLEFVVTKPGEDLGEIHVAGEVAEDVADSRNSTCPGICVFLLVGGCIVYDERSDSGLDLRNVSAIEIRQLCRTIPALIEKSRTYTNKVAQIIVETSTPRESGFAPKSPRRG